MTVRRVGVWMGRKVLDSLSFSLLIPSCLPVGELHADFHHSQAKTLRLLFDGQFQFAL